MVVTQAEAYATIYRLPRVAASFRKLLSWRGDTETRGGNAESGLWMLGARWPKRIGGVWGRMGADVQQRNGTLLTMPRNQSARPAPWRYGVAIVATLIAILISHFFHDLFDATPSVLYLAVIVISAWYGGFGPGALATLAGAVAILYFFLNPHYSFSITELRTAFQIVVFIAIGLMTSYLSGARLRAEEGLRQSRDQLAAVLQGVADGIIVQDASGKVIYANDAAARFNGYPAASAMMAATAEQSRARFDITDADGQPIPVGQFPGRRALLGEPSPEMVLRFRSRETGEERWSIVQATPIADAQGGVQFAVNIFRDITANHRTEETLRFLTEASALLASSLDYETTLQQVTHLAVPQIADWCAVEMRDGDAFRPVAVAHVDPAKVEIARDLRQRYPPDPADTSGIPGVVRSGKPVLVSEVTDEMLVAGARSEEYLRVLRALGMRSIMIVPLIARDAAFGAISFVAAESGRRFDATDLALAEELAPLPNGARLGRTVPQALRGRRGYGRRPQPERPVSGRECRVHRPTRLHGGGVTPDARRRSFRRPGAGTAVARRFRADGRLARRIGMAA